MDMSKKPAPSPSPSVADAKKKVATTKATKAPSNPMMKKVTDKYGKDYYKVTPGSPQWNKMANDNKTFGD